MFACLKSFQFVPFPSFLLYEGQQLIIFQQEQPFALRKWLNIQKHLLAFASPGGGLFFCTAFAVCRYFLNKNNITSNYERDKH
jgi:hypothetical protein